MARDWMPSAARRLQDPVAVTTHMMVTVMMTVLIMNNNSHCYDDKAPVTCQNQCCWHYLPSSSWQPSEVGVIINRPLTVGVKGLKLPP